MTRNDFASLGSSMFSVVVRKRLALKAARDAVLAEIDADTCDRRCKCERRPLYDAAIKAEADAYHDARAAEDSWAAYCAIRRDDIAFRG